MNKNYLCVEVKISMNFCRWWRLHINSPSIRLFMQLAVFEFENFRGNKVELSGECKDAFEKAQRVGSVIVESGP